MDYDDKDFHSQNLHLVGEGNPKYPPVLQPYALPKFDFDDSLHGHLRFDGLVETEVFLGIEDDNNHWIGDFAHGSTGIEFRSSAVESLRRNNVWSEATSSESVEMLLKSVGQEEVIPSETVIENLDACDELRCLIKHMEPRLKNEDSILSKVQDVTDLRSTLPLDESPRDFSAHSLVEESIQTHRGDLCDESSNDLEPSTVSENCGLLISEGTTSAVEYPVVKLQEDSLASGIQVENLVTSVDGLVTSSSELNYEGVQHQVNDVYEENPECHLLREESEMDNKNADRDLVDSYTSQGEKPHSLSSKAETNVEVSAIEISIINMEEPDSNMSNDRPNYGLGVECCTGELSRVPVEIHKSEDVILDKGSDTGSNKPCEVREQGLSPVALESNSRVERHVVELSTSAEIPSGLDPAMESFVEATHEENRNEEKVLGSGQSLTNEILLGKAETSLSSVEDYKVSKGEGHEISNSHEGAISSLTIAKFPPDMHCEEHFLGDLKGVHDASEVSRKILSFEGQTSPLLVSGPVLTNDQTKTCSDVGVYNKVGFVSDVECECLSNDHSNAYSKVGESLDKGVHLSSFDEAMKDDSIVSELHHSTATDSKLGIDVALENSNLLSCGASDDVHLPSKNGVKIDVDPKECLMSQLDRTDKAAIAEASLSSQSVSEKLPVSEAEAETQKACHETETNEVNDKGTKETGECPTEKHGNVMEATGVTQSNSGVTLEKCIKTKSEDVSEMITKNNATHTQPGALLLKETTQKVQEGKQATLVSNDENSGKIEPTDNRNALEIQAGSVHSVSLPESHAKYVSQEDLCGSADCYEPVCGSSELSEGTHGKVDAKVLTNEKTPVTEVFDGDAIHVSSNTHEPKGNGASKEKRSGSVDVSSIVELPKGDAGTSENSFPTSPAPKVAQRSPSDSGIGSLEPKTTTPNICQATALASDVETVRGRAKGTPETKRRRPSAKAAGKSKKEVQVKETTPVKQSGRLDKFSNFMPSPSGNFQHVKSNEMQHSSHVKGSNSKPNFVAATTSGLPDLNAIGSQTALFQQSFTEFQQVQLRAQIFVYGALIQGIAPEEVYMMSAFDGPDGGRSMWENVWHTYIERLRDQKAGAIDSDTPLCPRSEMRSAGTKASDQVTKPSSLQSKDTSSPAGQSSTKGTQTIISPMIPLSSPLWSVSTPVGDIPKSSVMPRGSVSNYQQSLSSLRPFQTPTMKNFVGHSASWMPQASFHGPWVVPPQSSVPDASFRFSAFPSTEAVQLNPVKETSTPNPSATKLVFSGPIVHTGDQRSGLAGAISMIDSKKMLPSSGQQSVHSKPRKRKKNSVSEERDQIVLKPLSELEPVVTSSLPLSVSITTLPPSPIVSKAMSEKLILPASPAFSYDHLKKVGHSSVYGSNLPEETLGKFKETRKQAEDANAFAAAAVGHCQEIWNQLDKHKNSGLSSDVEAKLASAAVQVAAAAAVAKAAAAAASIASSAALQAKLMADETMISTIGGNSSGQPGTFFDEVNGKATPASILRSDDGANSSSSIIMAAREAAWRRVEDASVASKRAENLDAFVKAAELAAEAVSQAGTIVSMGDPLPLSKLVEAGPQGYWKVPQVVSSGPVTKSADILRDQPKGAAGEVGDICMKNSKDRQSSGKVTHTIVNVKSQSVINVGKEPIDDHLRLMDVPSESLLVGERESGEMSHKYSDLSKNISVVLESGIGSESSPIVIENELEKAEELSKGNIIKEGSQVEVFKDDDGCKAAWFTAKVLSVEDGKAFVSYPEIYLDQGLGGQVKEWMELESEGDKAPKIRLARPITTMQFEGTRKRHRAALGGHTWSVGDRVDAWITDSWWEGIVTDKNKKDETSLTVHFPAQGVTSVVKAWHLRSSLTWKDGQWIEWPNLRNDSSLKDDMPREKRPKFGSPAVEAKVKTSKNNNTLDSGKVEETRLLDLSSNERVFNIGKNARTTNKPDGTRTIRTGLQEGSRVKFGVPKPGKKRKFMEVSKHFVSGQTAKTCEAIDSAKPCLMPHGQGLRGLKNTAKIDSKEKRVADSKLKVSNSGKQQGISGRGIPLKGDSSTNAFSALGAGIEKDRTRIEESTSQVGTTSVVERSFSTTEGTAENPIVFSSSAPASDAPSKRVSNGKTDRTNKGKLALASGKLGIIEENKVSNDAPVKSTSGVVEPRRSNRRIQPTSRLLEGLQSSLIISKIPSFSHGRGHRSQNRNTSKR